MVSSFFFLFFYLAQIVSPSSKDIISLYNNRSAMYLKEENVALSMQDITVLLALDPKHIKGRVRRAKIYEEQVRISSIDLPSPIIRD